MPIVRTTFVGKHSIRRRIPFLTGSLAVAGFAILCVLGVLSTASRTAAQGCAQCYQGAAASGVAGRAALRHGIFILLVPAISLFCAILSLIYRRRNPVRSAVSRLP